MTKTIKLFDPEVGFYETEVPDELEKFPHLVNETCVLGLSLLQEAADASFALGYEQLDGAVSPWFDNLEQLEQYCLQPGSREEMRQMKSRLSS